MRLSHTEHSPTYCLERTTHNDSRENVAFLPVAFLTQVGESTGRNLSRAGRAAFELMSQHADFLEFKELSLRLRGLNLGGGGALAGAVAPSVEVVKPTEAAAVAAMATRKGGRMRITSRGGGTMTQRMLTAVVVLG